MKLRIWAIGAVGVLIGAILMITTGASGLGGSGGGVGSIGQLNLNAGESLNVSCGGPSLAWGQGNLTSGALTCAADPTTTTAAPTTTTGVTTTLPASTTTTTGATTTTAPSGGSSSGCVFVSAPAGDTPAFCDTFNEGPATNPTNAREGALSSVVWGTSRTTGNQNYGESANDWASAQLSTCGSTALVNPPDDIQICNGELVDTVNDGGAVTSLAMYPKQPFDFAGRTGTITFNVSDDSQGSHGAWPELWMSDQPVSDPFTHEGDGIGGGNLPQNGFGIRFAGCTDANANQSPCPSGAGHVGVDSAVVVANHVESDTFAAPNPAGLKVIGMGDIKESGPGQVNHIEVRVSQSQLDVYGTDAYTPGGTLPPLVHIATIPNANLSFTRGVVWMEDSHYNGNKFGTQGTHAFTWNNFGFDGPVLPRDLGFDVPDNHVPDNGTQAGPSVVAQDTGYYVPAGTTKTLVAPGVTGLAAASGALVVFDYAAISAPGNLTVTLNGHAVTMAAPTQAVAVPFPVADVVAGDNQITFAAGPSMNVMNVSLIMQGAGG